MHAKINEFLNSFLKVSSDWAASCGGRLFHARGPATQKALSPSLGQVRETSTDKVSADQFYAQSTKSLKFDWRGITACLHVSSEKPVEPIGLRLSVVIASRKDDITVVQTGKN